MNSINIYENKTLKLQNVIVRRLDLESDDQNLFDSEINKISTYIQTHGANQIGPLIQYSKVSWMKIMSLISTCSLCSRRTTLSTT